MEELSTLRVTGWDFATALAVVMGRCGTNEPLWASNLALPQVKAELSMAGGTGTLHICGLRSFSTALEWDRKNFLVIIFGYLFLVSGWGTDPQKLS